MKGKRLTFAALALAAMPTIFAAPGEYDLAAIIWPAFQPEPRWKELGIFPAGKGEWENIWLAESRYKDDHQPRKPLWGYENEADPRVIERRIDAATSAGVNVFIYDWYWYDGRAFLEEALDKGFLGAQNNERMRFYIMWANHEVRLDWDRTVPRKWESRLVWDGAVKLDEFKRLADRWVAKYFTRKNYYRINGKPVFWIYLCDKFVKDIGGVENARAAIDYLREAAMKAGLPGVHIQVNGLQGKASKANTDAIGADDLAVYSWNNSTWDWMHPQGQKDMDIQYAAWRDKAIADFDDNARNENGLFFVPSLTLGWDPNPRFPSCDPQAIVHNPEPAEFEIACRKVKAWTDRHTPAGRPKLITINAWNEWSEGSCLEPDTHWGYGYLNALRRVFVEE